MKEKILALLIAKFSGARKDGLAQMATMLSLQAEKEEDATALVEKLTDEKVNNFIKDWRSDVDKEVSEAKKSIETNLKKKYDFVEKKAEEDDPSKKNPSGGDDIKAMIKAAVAEVVTPLQQELAGFKGENVRATRLQALQAKLTDVPESFKTQKLSDFSRMSFENDEQFNEYLQATETGIKAFNQELADKGLGSTGKPILGQRGQDGVSAGVAAYVASKTKEGGDSLGGKEV